jgi:nicotinate-nucleotide--dimethylbenzimidazole phosphoribosyltransferase
MGKLKCRIQAQCIAGTSTTAAAALLAALANADAAATVGRGTGVDDEQLAHKRRVVDRVLALHRSASQVSARECLRCVGGLEIAAMAGAAREAARLGIAVVADGFISTTSILAALHDARESAPDQAAQLAASLFFAHRSAEAGHRLALDECSRFDGCAP